MGDVYVHTARQPDWLKQDIHDKQYMLGLDPNIQISDYLFVIEVFGFQFLYSDLFIFAKCELLVKK